MSVVLVRCLRRLDRLTREEFREDMEQRARRGLQWSDSARLTQFHTVPDEHSDRPGNRDVAGTSYEAVSAAESGYDAISLAWFDDEDALRAEVESERFQAELARETWFVDHERSFARVADALCIFEPEPVETVLVQCLRRRRDITVERFHEIWDEHAQYGHTLRGMGFLTGYYQIRWAARPSADHLLPLGREQADWDGLVVTYVESRAALKAMLAAPLLEGSAEHAGTFLEPDGYLPMTTTRVPLRVPNV